MTDVLNPTTTPVPVPGQMPVSSRKIFMRTSEEPPVFINSAEFASAGMDVFMDVGVVPVESIVAAAKVYREHPDKPAPIEFHVSFRFGMSLQAAILIHQRLTQILQQGAAAQQEGQEPPVPEKEG
jgi:hypothetical protein